MCGLAYAVLVAWRSRRATILRLLAPGIFLLLALVIQLSLDANSRRYVFKQERTQALHPAFISRCIHTSVVSSCSCLNDGLSAVHDCTALLISCCTICYTATCLSCRAAGIRALDVSGPEPIADIPDCHQDVYIGSRPCVTFVYSPNTSSVAQVGHMLPERVRSRHHLKVTEFLSNTPAPLSFSACCVV